VFGPLLIHAINQRGYPAIGRKLGFEYERTGAVPSSDSEVRFGRRDLPIPVVFVTQERRKARA
jgi:hypothetical protein